MSSPKLTRRGAGALLGAAVAGTALAGRAEASSSGEREFAAQPEAGRVRRPNLLVILGDDLGWGDLGCYGAPEIRTPNLDALARQGVRFTDGYSAASVCSPTRFGLYTGRYPGRLRGGLEEPIDLPDEQYGIPPGHPTLASLLAASGYTTALYGKWHCGYLPWFSPIKSGWQEFFGNFSGGMDYYSKLSYFGVHDLYEDEVPVESLEYYTDTLADRARHFLRRPHTQPWLLNLNFTTPHWPWEAPGDTATSRELTARLRAGEKQVLQHHDGGSLATYRKMVESLDGAIGSVLRALRETGQERDTLVLFASDNGGERFSYTWPFSGGKGDLYEGGIRVPTVLRWPARIGGGQVSSVPVVTQDWTATLLELAGAQPDPAHPLDGRSLAGYLLRGERLGEADLFWRTRQYRALRRGTWKYLRKPGPVDALFDLTADPHEQANLASRRPEVLTDLRARWERINSTLLAYPA
ncbi:sulfatase-like hydrolase/transferase [Kutzneria viridogrisea]|uniref:Arylsulfatase A-like enzyme n=1 Tax=Kutzneria viridogrisea TaxID=47990 RepID=A0ABR6BH01_9PSEU|nr:arylsulfatase A-like enzyme [Kutzneria viridogrisea]